MAGWWHQGRALTKRVACERNCQLHSFVKNAQKHVRCYKRHSRGIRRSADNGSHSPPPDQRNRALERGVPASAPTSAAGGYFRAFNCKKATLFIFIVYFQ
jgi:hypothetical protein